MNVGAVDQDVIVNASDLYGDWFHLAFVMADGEKGRMFLNGQEATYLQQDVINYNNWDGQMRIGNRAHPSPQDDAFEGNLDDYRIWLDTAITDDDIAAVADEFCTVKEPAEIETNADSFLRQGAKDRNEGANPMMRVRKSGKNRAVIGFDSQAISDFGTVTKATLRLNIRDIGSNWGSGRTVDAHPLIVDFAEGNGKAADVPGPEQTRGNGPGVTWNCAIDTDISNQKADCDPKWIGGNFSTATATGVTHTSGMSGAVEWDVTADVLAGATSWLIKKTEEGQNGRVEYYSREGAADESNSSLAPTLILE